MARYEKHALLQEVLASLSVERLQYAQRCGKELWLALQRKKKPRAPSNQFFFIELFTGSARLTQSLRAKGFHCVAIDIANGPHHGLMVRRARRTFRI